MKYTLEQISNLNRDEYKWIEHGHLQDGSPYTVYYIFSDDLYVLAFRDKVICEAKNELQIYKKLVEKLEEWNGWKAISCLEKVDGVKYFLASSDWKEKVRVGVWDETYQTFNCPYNAVILFEPEFYKEYPNDIYI